MKIIAASQQLGTKAKNKRKFIVLEKVNGEKRENNDEQICVLYYSHYIHNHK